MAKLDTNALFTQYINVVNKAIGEHKAEFPYNALIKGADKLLQDKNIGVAVYERDPDKPHDYFTIRLQPGGKLDVVEHGKTHGSDRPATEWKVGRDHLQKVVDEPNPYIEHPAKLDLDWLRSRIGAQT